MLTRKQTLNRQAAIQAAQKGGYPFTVWEEDLLVMPPYPFPTIDRQPSTDRWEWIDFRYPGESLEGWIEVGYGYAYLRDLSVSKYKRLYDAVYTHTEPPPAKASFGVKRDG